MAEDNKYDDVEYKDEDYVEIKIPSEQKPLEQVESTTDFSESRSQAEEKPTPIAVPVKKKVSKKKRAKKKASAQAVSPQPRKRVQKQEKSSSWIWVLLIILGLAIIAIVVFLSLSSNASEQEGTVTGQVAALVNSKPIYMDEINEIYDRLPPEYLETTSKELLLDQLIDQELLLQAAQENNVVVSDEELAEYTDELMGFYGLDNETLEQLLSAQGVSREEFDESNRKQLVVSKYLDEVLLARVIIEEQAVIEYYEQNPELFFVPESAILRHILISNETELEEGQTPLGKAQEVLSMIEGDNSNFCELVTEYSDDAGSVMTCGEYEVFQDGQFVPEFEEAALDLSVDEIRIVETMFGSHIIWKVSENEAAMMPFEEVREDIIALLRQQQSNQELMTYLEELREQATIETYPLEGGSGVLPQVIMPEEDIEQQVPPVIEVVDVVDQEQEVVDDAQEEVEVAPPTPSSDESFGECLTQLGTTVYGVSWSPGTQELLDVLTDYSDQYSYVDCDDSPCEGIDVYPTIIAGNVVLEGRSTLNRIASATGCQI